MTSKSWGGNEKWAADAALGLSERGHRVTVLWTYEPVRRELAARGLDARRIRLWGDLNPLGFISLVRVLRAERADVLILTKQREYWMGGLAARFARRPLVVFRYGTTRPLADDFKRRQSFGRMADVIIVNSLAVRDALLESPWVRPESVRVVLNAVSDAPVPEGLGRRLLTDLGIPQTAPVVCGAGRLDRVKGFDVLIEAFEIVREDCPDARLLILGEGGRRQSLERAACERGVADAVLLPGQRTDVREILSGVDVYVLSSRYEGMANTLLEAMSVGAPIVATDVTSTREAVTDGREALVVPPGNPGAMADAVVRVLNDDELSARLGEAALERARRRFSYARMLDELEDALSAGLAGRSGPKSSGSA